MHVTREWTQEEIDDHSIDASGDDEEFFDCHIAPDGQCGAAGSEWCDWDCPIMRRRGRQ